MIIHCGSPQASLSQSMLNRHLIMQLLALLAICSSFVIEAGAVQENNNAVFNVASYLPEWRYEVCDSTSVSPFACFVCSRSLVTRTKHTGGELGDHQPVFDSSHSVFTRDWPWGQGHTLSSTYTLHAYTLIHLLAHEQKRIRCLCTMILCVYADNGAG